jgi:YrbI family 3-deoxy-D-manno-octulosonate 8-phosphate phosphatase
VEGRAQPARSVLISRVDPLRSTIAVIPARGGSKGVSRKNLRVAGGLPLIAHTVRQAKLARTLSRVIVSTDDQEIAAAAVRYGAEVIERPSELSGDSASSESAVMHALEALRRQGAVPDIVVLLQCTSPLMLAEDIDGTVEALERDGADSAVAVAPFFHFLWKRDDRGAAVAINHEQASRPRRQEMDPQFIETGAVYAMRTAEFERARHRFFGKTVMHVTPAGRCLEVDDSAQLDIADALLRRRQRQEQIACFPKPIAALVCDFDGVFTDNRVLVAEDGRESVVCSRSDGMGVEMLRAAGLPVVVVSREANAVVAARCRKLQLECRTGVVDKLKEVTSWLQTRGLSATNTIYLGNDLNDVECLRAVGCGVVVADAHPGAMRAARLVLASRGGKGAVRELTDLILAAMEQYVGQAG